MKTHEVYFAVNRNNNTATLLYGFSCFEQIQGAFRCGILMPDGNSATGIGKCRSMREFLRRLNHGTTTLLLTGDETFELTIQVRGRTKSNRARVSASMWRSWSGERFIDGIKVTGKRFYFLSEDIYGGTVA